MFEKHLCKSGILSKDAVRYLIYLQVEHWSKMDQILKNLFNKYQEFQFKITVKNCYVFMAKVEHVWNFIL